ncbi:MAG: hypothetical protein BA874_08750, partial [Desulfuromonadales bacterium C00003068]
MTLWFSRVIITTFLVLGVMSFSPAPSQANTRVSKRVLVLHSYHQGYAWTDNVTQALQQQFEQSDFNVELFIEYMDTKRLQPESAFPRLASLYEFKYSGLRFDAIICCDNNALDFLARYHHSVFQSSPVIFCGINNFEPSMLSGHDDFTGVYEQLDLRASLDLIVELHPSTRQVAVVSDATITSHLILKQLVEVEAEYRDRLSFIYLEALRPNELGPAVGQLPKDSAILLLTYLRDRDGTTYPFTRAPEIIRNHSNVPIYTLWGDFVVDGVMGGLVISGQQQGALAVNWVLQLFSGIAIDKLPPPQASPNSFLFNYQELQRLGLSVAQLPDGSVVVNEPQTFYYRYRTGVWVMTTLFSWLTLSVLFLTRANFLRRQAERAIQTEKEFTETVLDAIAVPLYYRDTNGVYLGTNNAGIEFFGFEKNKRDIIGKTSYDLFSREVADKAHAADQQLIANGGTQSYESVMINGAGESRHVFFQKALFFDSQSTIAGVVGTMLDITELKQAQQLASRFGRILDSSLEEIYMVDANLLNLIRTTVGSRKNLGYTQDELSRMTIADLLPEFSLESLQQHLQPLCTNQQQTLVITSEIQRKNGSCYPVELHLQHTEIEGDAVIVVMAQDITERVKLERLKNEMLSMVSHELRTPLTGMLGFTEYLLEYDPPAEQRIDCLQTLYKETLKLQELIDNLLNLQRLKARQDAPSTEPINIRELLEEVRHLFSHASEKHFLQLECQDQLPQLSGNSSHLMQVLKNLVSNAIKYSPAGGTITLGAKQQSQTIRIWVSDEGMGISEQDQQLIFDHFYRVDN